VLGLAAFALPDARRRGIAGIAALGIAQVALVAVAAPGVPLVALTVGTLLLCGLLAAFTLKGGRYP
jgi:hypothetical protein